MSPAAALCLAAAVLPSTFSGALQDSYVLPKLAAAATLLAAAAALGLRAPARRGAAPLDAPLALLFAAAALSAWLAPDPWPSWMGPYRSHAWGLLGWSLCVLAYRLAASREPGFAERLALWTAAGSIPVSSYALLQWAGLEPFRGVPPPPFGRVFSTLGGPVQLGAYLMVALCAALGAAAAAGAGGRGKLEGAVGRGALALALPALAATGSRAAWLGALAGGAAFAFARGWAGRRHVVAAAALCVGLGVTVIGLRGGRFLSDLQRVEVWRAAWSAFRERPMTGVGPGGFSLALRRHQSEKYAGATGGGSTQVDAHNDWLQVLAGLGLLGLAAYLWLHLRAWAALRAALTPDDPARAALAAALCALAVEAKLNAVPWMGLFLGALFAGAAWPRAHASEAGAEASEAAAAPSSARPGPCWRAAGFLLVVLAAGNYVARVVAADRAERQGTRARAEGRPREAAEALERAIAWSPYETVYRLQLANLLWDVGAAAEPEARKELLDRAAQVAEAGARRRPLDPAAHHLLGLAELRRTQWAGEHRLLWARRALERAEALDPYHQPILKDAMRVAVLEGDAARAEALRAKLLRLLRLYGCELYPVAPGEPPRCATDPAEFVP